MSEDAKELLALAQKIHDLLELLAEDKIAQRDAKQRTALREIVGSSVPKQKSVMLMDGTRTQADIRRVTKINQGHLSTLVGELRKAKLLAHDESGPNLAISIPPNFFEQDEERN